MRKRHGVVKVDSILFEGMAYPIRLRKDTGTFEIEVNEETLYNKDLEALKSKARGILAEISKKHDWEAVIEIQLKNNKWGSSGYFFGFERHFRCQLQSDKWLFRRFMGDDGSNSPEDLKAELGRPTGNYGLYPDPNYIYIPYSPESWEGCLKLMEAKEMLEELVVKTLKKAGKNTTKKLQELKDCEVVLVPKKRGKKCR